MGAVGGEGETRQKGPGGYERFRATSANQIVTKYNILARKARRVAAMFVPQAEALQQSETLVDYQRTLQHERRRAFDDDEMYQVQSGEANYI